MACRPQCGLSARRIDHRHAPRGHRHVALSLRRQRNSLRRQRATDPGLATPSRSLDPAINRVLAMAAQHAPPVNVACTGHQRHTEGANGRRQADQGISSACFAVPLTDRSA